MINTCLSCLFLEEQREFEHPMAENGFSLNGNADVVSPHDLHECFFYVPLQN